VWIDGEARALVPIIVLTEILYLEEKKRIHIQLKELLRYLQQHSQYEIVPYTLSLLMMVREISDIPELHDRIIAATARRYDAVVLTRDPSIASLSAVRTLW
jgi:predicted nucleic acid-binding protein